MSYTTRLQRNVRLLNMMRQIPRHVLPEKIKAIIRNRMGRFIPTNPADRYRNHVQAKIDHRQGYLVGNQHFWEVLPTRDWKDVEERLFQLTELKRDDWVRDFLHKCLHLGQGDSNLLLLARSGRARHVLADLLRSEDYGPDGALAARIRKSVQFSGNLAGAALYLLEAEEVAPLLERIANLYPNLPKAYHNLLDSHVLVPSSRPSFLQGTVSASPSRRPARHRLIIVDVLQDPTRLSLLFADAEKVTIFSPNDLYGKLSIADDQLLHFRPEEINIAHPRSRITRFSAQYHALHDETRQIAQEMIDELEVRGKHMLAEAAPYAALHLADKLFFQVLAAAAFEDYITANEYDQIVIASTGRIQLSDFFRGLASGIDLTNDPRIEFTMLSPSGRNRVAFVENVHRALVPTAINQPSAPNVEALTRPLDEILSSSVLTTRSQTVKMRRFPVQTAPAVGDDTVPALDGSAEVRELPRILFITTQVSAYNSSSIRYLDILSRHYNTLAGFVGTNITAFFKSLPSDILPPKAASVQLLSNATAKHHPLLANALLDFVSQSRERLLREGRGRLSAHVMSLRAKDVALGGIQSAYLHWITLQHWFDQMAKDSRLPDLVVVSPLRPALAGMAAAAARRNGIPSLGLEPHGLNAAYCRYCLVGTDRYGVITSFFRDEAARGFAIPAERIDVIGSPRLQAPAAYDVASGSTAARKSIAENNSITFSDNETVITFFTQPSGWEQIAGVWRIILQAVKDLPSVRLLLKLHPEEGPTRGASYMAIAEAIGMTERVHNITSTAIEAIEAADLVLACYSATVVEATLYRKPVFCVINGTGDYPLDQHKVVKAPLLRDVLSLRTEIETFIADPTPFLERAERFLAEEPQSLSGPEQPLIATIDAILSRPAAENLRTDDEMPRHLFIEGPYRVFDI